MFQISIKNRLSSSAKRRRWETRKRQIRIQRIEESRSYRKPQKAGSQIRVRIAENAKVPSFPFSNGCLDSKIFSFFCVCYSRTDSFDPHPIEFRLCVWVKCYFATSGRTLEENDAPFKVNGLTIVTNSLFIICSIGHIFVASFDI